MAQIPLTLSDGQAVKLESGSFKHYNKYTVTLTRSGGSSTKVELFKDPSEGYMNAMTVPGDASSKEIAMIKEAIDEMPM